MKIYIKTKSSRPLPNIIDKGDWIDLSAAEDIQLAAPKVGDHNKVEFKSSLIDLGVAMKLPAGFEAIVAPRSSLFKKKGITLANSIGVIDNTYQGNEDYWKFHALAFQDTVIIKGERIAQFRIQLSQKATIWQKLRWLFCSKIVLVKVNELSKNNRGGIGSTGGMN